MTQLYRPARSIRYLTVFVELAVLVTLPVAIVMLVVDAISTGSIPPPQQRLWIAGSIALVPYHIAIVDRLLRRPRRHAPPTWPGSVFFATAVVIALFFITAFVVAGPALTMLGAVSRGEGVSTLSVLNYLTLCVFYPTVLWLAWLAMPQLDVEHIERDVKSAEGGDAAS